MMTRREAMAEFQDNIGPHDHHYPMNWGDGTYVDKCAICGRDHEDIEAADAEDFRIWADDSVQCQHYVPMSQDCGECDC